MEEFPVVLKQADLRWYREFFGQAIPFCWRPPFPALQMVWLDAEGRFLRRSGTDEHYRQSQPQLWLKPTQHPEGAWVTLATR
ncbi:DUF4262 domain-containing protein [Streptomyces mirabilis]|uniref:DUF4262 domain-containing protein n=1 Tax=Streptomyces mirabilis TaxID=68239 RepID=UPI00371F9C81